MKLEAAVEYKIRYIPVAEETEGGTPILNKRGLKMTPPPRPKAPETQPPMIEKKTILVRLCVVNSMSPSTKPAPNSFFIRCSNCTRLTEEIIMKMHRSKKLP